jgi:hypothetical protein
MIRSELERLDVEGRVARTEDLEATFQTCGHQICPWRDAGKRST